MRTVNIQEAKTHLSRLIAKDDQPRAKTVRIHARESRSKKLPGVMKGQYNEPMTSTSFAAKKSRKCSTPRKTNEVAPPHTHHAFDFHCRPKIPCFRSNVPAIGSEQILLPHSNHAGNCDYEFFLGKRTFRRSTRGLQPSVGTWLRGVFYFRPTHDWR